MQDEIEAIARAMQELRGHEDDQSKRRADELLMQLVELLIMHVPERALQTAKEVLAAYQAVDWFHG